MPRDYAKYQSQSKQKLAEPGWGKRLLLLVLVLCVLAAIFIGLYVYKNNSPESTPQKFYAWITQLHSRLSHKQTLNTKTLTIQQIKQEPEVRFNFYTELPNMQVTLPETEEAPPAQTAMTKPAASPHDAPLLSTASLPKDKSNTKKTPQYILQMGVFKNETAAGQLRVSLLLAGFEADIVQSEEGNTVLYRVQKGPYATFSKAKEIQRQLQNKGITGVVKQL